MLKPTTKHWAGLLVFLADTVYPTIKKEMDERKKVVEEAVKDIEILKDGNEYQRQMVVEKLKRKVDEMIVAVKEMDKDKEETNEHQ